MHGLPLDRARQPYDRPEPGPRLASQGRERRGVPALFGGAKRSGVEWNEAALDRWLANPQEFVPGNTMTYAGLKNPKDRQDVIAYLEALAQNRAPQPAQQGGGMRMGVQSRKPDLRQAPAEAQVKSVRYCGDTYTIETADGKRQKIWEFNLRLKTDSSKLGPAPGNPVVIGAGMQGDRASLVFSSPKEISETIRPVCP